MSILCLAKTSRSAEPKSPPTTATTRTSVKKLAEIEKWEAEPPSMRSRLPNGVSTASNATEPTTSNDISNFGLRSWNCESGIAILEFGILERFLLSANCLLLTLFRLWSAQRFQIFQRLYPELAV